MNEIIVCPFCGKTHRRTAKYCPSTGRLLTPTSQKLQRDLNQESQIGVPQAESATGQHLPLEILRSRFSIINKVGEGGMAAVYQAADLRLPGKVWAIKEMSERWIPDPEDRTRAVDAFEQEALLLAKLDHPNLPRVIDSFSEKGRQYLVMEFVEGQTLEEILEKRSAPFTEQEVLPWATQLCDALSYLHNLPSPVIFRDLKPSNIMIDQSGHVKLIDFGIVRFFKPGKSKDTMAIGTQGYCAPEAISGQTDSRSDLYSLCVVLHEILTRHNPTTTLFNLPPMRDFNPSVSPEWERIIRRGLAHERNDRWPSIKALSEELSKTKGYAVRTMKESEAYLSPPTVIDRTHKVEQHPKIQTSRPTTRLVAAAAQLSSRQVAAALGIITVAVVGGIWLLAPILVKFPAIWDNIPIVAIVAPCVFTAVPRRWVASISHTIIAFSGGLTLFVRLDIENDYLLGLLIGVLASALFIEIWLRFLDKVRGAKGKEAWLREVSWFCLMAGIATGILYQVAFQGGMNPWLWLGAVVMAFLGWFIGDSVKEYLNMRRARS